MAAELVGDRHRVRFEARGPTLTITVDDRHLTTFTDTDSPYLTGGVALYTEDAHVTFTNPTVTP